MLNFIIQENLQFSLRIFQSMPLSVRIVENQEDGISPYRLEKELEKEWKFDVQEKEKATWKCISADFTRKTSKHRNILKSYAD